MICYHNDICYTWDKKFLCTGRQDFFLAGRILARENPEKIMGGENEEKGKGKREKQKVKLKEENER
jgi:hypothetical protein